MARSPLQLRVEAFRGRLRELLSVLEFGQNRLARLDDMLSTVSQDERTMELGEAALDGAEAIYAGVTDTLNTLAPATPNVGNEGFARWELSFHPPSLSPCIPKITHIPSPWKG